MLNVLKRCPIGKQLIVHYSGKNELNDVCICPAELLVLSCYRKGFEFYTIRLVLLCIFVLFSWIQESWDIPEIAFITNHPPRMRHKSPYVFITIVLLFVSMFQRVILFCMYLFNVYG